MPKDRITRLLDLIEGASDDEQLALIVSEALDAMGDGEAAVAACVDWAASSALLVELRDAVLDRMDEPGPEPGFPPGVELLEEAPGAGNPELEEMAGADLTPQLEGILFAMYRHELIALAEDADDRPGPGSRTLLTEPPSFAHDELAVLGLIEIEGAASEPGKPRWLVMLTPAGQLRAHRIARQRLALLAEPEDGDGNEGHPS
jgi:hypothetical protein